MPRIRRHVVNVRFRTRHQKFEVDYVNLPGLKPRVVRRLYATEAEAEALAAVRPRPRGGSVSDGPRPTTRPWPNTPSTS
jgi:hypothetical protein